MRELSKDTGLEIIRPEGTSTSDVLPIAGNRQGFDAVMIVLNVTGVASGSHTFEMRVSDDNSTFRAPDSALADESLLIESAADTGQYALDYLGSAPYVGIQKLQTGTSPEITFGAYLVKSDKARTG
jgi:hypothetical protein